MKNFNELMAAALDLNSGEDWDLSIRSYREAFHSMQKRFEELANANTIIELITGMEAANQREEAALRREENLKASADVLAQRVKDLEAAAIVPGVLRCAKCDYELMKTNLYFNSGTVGPGDSETEPCPNGCGPLWPVTWHAWAITGFAEAAKAVEQLPKPIRLPAPLLEVVGGDQVHGRVMANDMRTACIKAILAAGGKVEGVA